jgi:hypothetical protein
VTATAAADEVQAHVIRQDAVSAVAAVAAADEVQAHVISQVTPVIQRSSKPKVDVIFDGDKQTYTIA